MSARAGERPMRCWAGAVGVLLGAWFVGGHAQPQPAPVPGASAARPSIFARSEDGVRWQSLGAEQRQALQPLEQEWPSIDSQRKQKWLALANRFKTLGPEERARITARMSEWAHLTPAERGQARLRFEESRQLPVPDRTARWEAYQALPADSRQRFAARAASTASGPTDALHHDSLAASAAKTARDGREGKVNVVPNAALAQPPRAVGPTLVQAAPGATTTLITRRPAPPAHQQTGMPKIAATPEFVNRSTLLPKRGPQAAAVAPTPAPTTAGVIVSPSVAAPSPPSLPALPSVTAPAVPARPQAAAPAATPASQ